MSTSIPNPPVFTSPTNNQSFPDGTTQVTLSWTSVPGATSYAVRANDLTEAALRLPENNCKDAQGKLLDLHYLCVDGLTTNSFTMRVRPGHRYHCWVHAINAAGASQPAFVDFRVLVTDAAEFLFQCVQYVLQPGEQLNAMVKMRNTGSTTWTPAGGYKLGSQNPQDNTRWGTNRVNLPAGVQVPPGGTFDFVWRIQAPATVGTYDFQWRMLREGVRWFGDFTPNVRVTVRAANPAAGKLTRNATNGRILADGAPVVLRGGHYDLFEKNGTAWRSLTPTPGAVPPFVVAYTEGVEPCTPAGAPVAYGLPWGSAADNWNLLFTWLRRTNTNLMRLWLSNGTRLEKNAAGVLVPSDLVPFNVNAAGKYQVREAVENGFWYQPFFDRLSAFAALAEQKGVYLQISLFNYWDLTKDNPANPAYQTWSKSFWNPAMCSDATYGQNNLVNITGYHCTDDAQESDADSLRQCFFIHPPATSGLPNVQAKFVKRVMQALAGRKNIILEVMNEPHRGTLEERVRFNSRIVGNILANTGSWRPLISVNASGFQPGGTGDTDMDWWKAFSGVPGNNAPGYNEVDIISYHGLSAYLVRENVCGSVDSNVPAVDRAGIHRRLVAHSGKHQTKSIMFSTDAVRVNGLIHKYTVDGSLFFMHLRDGQVVTTYLEHYPEPSVRSDLADWALWCFQEGAATPGYVHLQNHSTFDLPYAEIGEAWQKANS
ncbi:MAG TPA: NBR1-Ig-like domain-containing protein [Pyrinomonadaceae bacterium]|nr:NBR1-Ig-like domain-containing protein [Pyrinomonadaceae bacterium]